MTEFKKGDRVRIVAPHLPSWDGQEGIIIGRTDEISAFDWQVEVPNNKWNTSSVSVAEDELELIEPAFKVGDRVRFVRYREGASHPAAKEGWYNNQTGTITAVSRTGFLTIKFDHPVPSLPGKEMTKGGFFLWATIIEKLTDGLQPGDVVVGPFFSDNRGKGIGVVESYPEGEFIKVSVRYGDKNNGEYFINALTKVDVSHA